MSLELEKLAEHWKETFSEMCEVVRTVEVHLDDSKYRVQVVKRIDHTGTYFDARYFIERDLILQPRLYADEKGTLSKPENMGVWVSYEHTWVHMHDPDSALSEALGFLAQRKKKI